MGSVFDGTSLVFANNKFIFAWNKFSMADEDQFLVRISSVFSEDKVSLSQKIVEG